MGRETLTHALEALNADLPDGVEMDSDAPDYGEDYDENTEEEVVDAGEEMTPVVEDAELENQMMEATEESNSQQELVDNIDQAEENVEALESLLDKAITLESLGGMTPELADAYATNADQLIRPILGYSFTTMHMPSLESFDTAGSRRTSTSIAVEGIKETLMKVLNAIVSAIQKVISWAKDLWKRLTDANHAFLRRIEKVRDKVDAIKKGQYKLPDNPEDVTISKSEMRYMFKGKDEYNPTSSINNVKFDLDTFDKNWDVAKIGGAFNRLLETQGRFLKIGFDRAQEHDFNDVINDFVKFNDTVKPYGSKKTLENKSSASDETKAATEYAECQKLIGGKIVTSVSAKQTALMKTKDAIFAGGLKNSMKNLFTGSRTEKATSKINEEASLQVFSGVKFGFRIEDDADAPDAKKLSEKTIKPLSLGDIAIVLNHAEEIHKLNTKILKSCDEVDKKRKKAMGLLKTFMAEVRNMKRDADESEAAARKFFNSQLSAIRKISLALSDAGVDIVAHSIVAAKASLDICDKSLKGATKVDKKKDEKKDDSKDKKKK